MKLLRLLPLLLLLCGCAREVSPVYALSELLDRSAQDGVLPDMPLYRVTDVLHADGTAILPALRVDAFGQTAPAGTAVFKNERLNCFLDGEIGGGAYA